MRQPFALQQLHGNGHVFLFVLGQGVPPADEVVGDVDLDHPLNQADVLVKFDRARVEEMLAGAPEGPVTLTAQWTFADGSASGQTRIKR